jgi:hypothetical protein
LVTTCSSSTGEAATIMASQTRRRPARRATVHVEISAAAASPSAVISKNVVFRSS